MKITFPNETKAYRDARNDLIEKEKAARRAMEAAAQARRQLPLGGKIPEDYVFELATEEGIRKIHLSELFEPGKDTLAVYSYMYGAKDGHPCPMCTAMLDSWDGAFKHISQRLSVAVVAEAPAQVLRDWSLERWRHLRALSTAGSDYNKKYYGLSEKGNVIPMLNVFKKTPEGIFHFWSAELSEADPGQDPRSLDMLNPIFNFFDMTPAGRGDFYTKLNY